MTAGIDLICYVFLLYLLYYLARVRPLSKVSIRIGEVSLGTVLLCDYNLGGRIGLLNTPSLATGDGILLLGTRAITTRGMHFPIDLVFLDDAKRVLGMESSVQPGRWRIKGPKGTRSILELGAGSIAAYLTEVATLTKVEVQPC